MSILTDIIKGFIGKLAQDVKDVSELNGRSDSNLIDTLVTLLDKANITKGNILKHVQKSPFKLV